MGDVCTAINGAWFSTTTCRLKGGIQDGPTWTLQKDESFASWWFQPIWKILISQFGSFPQIGMKIKHMWNHHLVWFGKRNNTQHLRLSNGLGSNFWGAGGVAAAAPSLFQGFQDQKTRKKTMIRQFVKPWKHCEVFFWGFVKEIPNSNFLNFFSFLNFLSARPFLQFRDQFAKECPTFLQLHRNQKRHPPIEQWKKPWLFTVYRGWNATQSYGDYNKPLYIKIPIDQPGIQWFKNPAGFFLTVAQFSDTPNPPPERHYWAVLHSKSRWNVPSWVHGNLRVPPQGHPPQEIRP